jgi:hypothetical protein
MKILKFTVLNNSFSSVSGRQSRYTMLYGIHHLHSSVLVVQMRLEITFYTVIQLENVDMGNVNIYVSV